MAEDTRTIDQFRAALANGHRVNQFQIIVTLPTNYITGEAQTSFEFLAFASSIPEQGTGSIDMNFRGLTAHVAGDPVPFPDWTVSIYNSRAFDIRKTLIKWKRDYWKEGEVSGNELMELSTADIYAITKNNVHLYETTLYNVWPKTIGSVELSFDTTNTVSKFDCVFSSDYAIENVDLVPAK